MTPPGYEAASPQPVPEMAVPSTITDEERNRYGALLDAAAGRGLLSSAEYQHRLGQVAEATSVAELQRLVTELPAFDRVGSTAAAAPSGSVDRARPATDSTPDLDAILWAGRTPAAGRRNRNNQWIVLAIIVGVLLVGLIALGLVAAHLAHTHSAGTAAAMVSRLSSLRL